MMQVSGEGDAVTTDNSSIKKAMTIEEVFKKNKLERRIQFLQEMAELDRISELEGARQAGEAKGERKVICEFLGASFGSGSQGLQDRLMQIDVRCIENVNLIDKILKKIFRAKSLTEAEAIINAVTK
jgi:hypothetical protein